MLEPLPQTVNGHEFWMMPVEGGTFQMGDEYGDLQSVCRPTHLVKVSNFFVGKYPVTQGLWKTVMGKENNPSFFEGDNRPVEQVSWDEAKVFIEKLNTLMGKKYRLPKEAEWEFAARGGSKSRGYAFAGSNKLKEVGWFDKNSHGETKPVGLKDANELGVFDLSGNVWEWCEDDWHPNYYRSPQGGSAWINSPERGLARVIRGGSWRGFAKDSRAAYRYHLMPDDRSMNIGFRLVLPMPSIKWSSKPFFEKKE